MRALSTGNLPCGGYREKADSRRGSPDTRYNGGDRTSIMLPTVQTEMMKSLKKTGKPVIFVMMTGSAIAVPWEDENLPAIINAWYGGQSAGTAIADVLFGDYNPAGRLPLTFYRSDNDLPDFNSYSMKNRTYRYFKGKPLYAFGHGLSYTQFRYDALSIPAVHTAGRNLSFGVRVTNSGNMDGEEVVQVYLHGPGLNANDPQRSLVAFRRIFLKKGESRVLAFSLTPEELSIADNQGKRQPMKGRLTISVGGSQPDKETRLAKKTIQAQVTSK